MTATFLWRSGQRQDESGHQAEGHSAPAEGRNGAGGVAQVCVTAHVGVVKIEAGGVFLPAEAALGGDGTALLIHAHLEWACKAGGRSGKEDHYQILTKT